VLAAGLACGLQPAVAQDQKFFALGDLKLTGGGLLRDCRIGYRTFGALNAAKSNAVLWPTWFTGKSADLAGSIGPGPGKIVDSSRYFVIAVDALANGVSTSPSNSQRQPGAKFPRITIRDMVNAERELVTREFGIGKLHAVMGVSMGGMQTFEWMVAYPDLVECAIPIVGTPWQTAYDQMLWSAAAKAIRLDPAFRKGRYRRQRRPEEGMRVAARITNLHIQTPEQVLREVTPAGFDEFIAGREKEMLARNDANDYLAQLDAMLTLDVRRGIGDATTGAVAGAVKARTLVIVGLRDHMVNPTPALELARALRADTLELATDCGHMAFGCESARIGAAVARFLDGSSGR
jgi:homoserine O-acetyltransferase